MEEKEKETANLMGTVIGAESTARRPTTVGTKTVL